MITPDAPPWFANVVRSVAQRYSLNVKVQQ
jgi:hypothetical protein